MVANFSGNSQAQDFVVKLSNHILAFNYRLELLWQYESHWYTYSKHAAYIPAVGDLDDDGLDEVNGGHFGLDNDGTLLWEKGFRPASGRRTDRSMGGPTSGLAVGRC